MEGSFFSGLKRSREQSRAEPPRAWDVSPVEGRGRLLAACSRRTFAGSWANPDIAAAGSSAVAISGWHVDRGGFGRRRSPLNLLGLTTGPSAGAR